MRESFFAALRVVVPMMLLMFLGWYARTNKMITRPAMKEFDRMLFKIFMPTLLFKNIYDMDFSQGFLVKEMIFAFVTLLALFIFCIYFPRLLTKDGNKSSVLGQAVGRPNYILFGVAVSEALYGEGNAGAVIMLSILVIPAINIFATIILELNRSGNAKPGRLFLAVLKNPMIIGAILAFIFKFFALSIPAPLWSVVRSVANSTTTVSFISLGVGLEMAGGMEDKRLLLWGNFLRMILVPLIFMPISILAGFRGESLCAMMIIFASPTAVASYPMAVAMGADGKLAGQLVCTTTVLSIFTIFLWTMFLKGFGLI